jgi:hypothetical protein
MKKLAGSIVLVIVTLAFLRRIFEIDYTRFADTLALMLVFVIGSMYSFALNGWRNGIKSFKTAFDRTATDEELRAAMIFFKTLEKAYLFFGCFGAIISLVNMFRTLEDASAIGISFALSFVNIAFALFLILLCVLPFKAIITQRIK